MARINLLPWRETLRKKRQRDFGISALAGVLVVAAACAGTHFYVEGIIKYQNKRNALLTSEIKAMDRKIKEIQKLERTKEQLLARMAVIQELQGSRPQVVHLFDELVKTVPEGAYLNKFVQKGSKLTLEGRAQSNARVSSYMRNIEVSEWLTKPNLQVISNKNATGTGMSHFTLAANQVSAVNGEEGDGSGDKKNIKVKKQGGKRKKG